MISHTEFEKLKYHIELVANRESDHISTPEFEIDRDENDGISIVLSPMGFDLEPDDEDIPDNEPSPDPNWMNP